MPSATKPVTQWQNFLSNSSEREIVKPLSVMFVAKKLLVKESLFAYLVSLILYITANFKVQSLDR